MKPLCWLRVHHLQWKLFLLHHVRELTTLIEIKNSRSLSRRTRDRRDTPPHDPRSFRMTGGDLSNHPVPKSLPSTSKSIPHWLTRLMNLSSKLRIVILKPWKWKLMRMRMRMRPTKKCPSQMKKYKLSKTPAKEMTSPWILKGRVMVMVMKTRREQRGRE